MTTKPAHRSTPYLSPTDYGTANIKEHLRHAGAAARDLAALARVVNSQPPDYNPGERGYVSLQDVVGNLGLSPAQEAAAKQSISDMVSDSRAAIGVSAQLREAGIENTLIPVLLRRGLKLAQEARTSGRNVFKAAPAGDGWEAIPNGHKGGYRRRKAGGGYEYAYPDGSGSFTTHDDPHAGEPGDVHEDHEKHTPKADVAAAYAKVAKRAQALGMNVDAHPHSGTTMSEVKELDALITRHEKAAAKKAPKPEPEADGEDDNPKPKPDLVTPDTDDEPAEEDEEDTSDEDTAQGDDTLALVQQITRLGERKGIPQETIEDTLSMAGTDPAELSTIRDYLSEMDDHVAPDAEAEADAGDSADTDDEADPGADATDTIPGLGHAVPESPHELAALRNHVKALEQALETMGGHLERHEKALHRKLKDDARRVRRSPSPEAVSWLNTRTRAFAILAFGAAAGLILGGPVAALLGLALADKHARYSAHMPGVTDAGINAASRAAAKIKGKVKKKPTDGDNPGLEPAPPGGQVAKSLTATLRRTPRWGDVVFADGAIVVLMPHKSPLLKARPPEVLDLQKSGGPYIGKRGGKWADPQHKIPWKSWHDPPKNKPAAHEVSRYDMIPFMETITSGKQYSEGDHRVNKYGEVETLRRVKIDDFKMTQSKVYAEGVDKHRGRKDGVDAPSTYTSPDGVQHIRDGHHRMAAARKDGRTDVLVWHAFADHRRNPIKHKNMVADAHGAGHDIPDDVREDYDLPAKVAKSLPPPPYALPPKNPWGLSPGQTLYVRKGEAWDTCPEVEVLPHAAFMWNGVRYQNASSLLKALTGRDKPGTTIKRYFGLGNDRVQFLKSVAYRLQRKYSGLSFASHSGAIRVRGDLRAAGFPGAVEGSRAMLLPATDAMDLLSEGDNG